MAEISDEDLRKQREKVDSLRARVSDSVAVREERERQAAREIEMAQLKGEEARLQGQINLNKEAAKVSNVRAGTADLLSTVRDEATAAEAVGVANTETDDEKAEQSAAKE